MVSIIRQLLKGAFMNSAVNINVIIGAATFPLALWGGNWWNQKFLERMMNESDEKFTARVEGLRAEIRGLNDKMDARFDLLSEKIQNLDRRVAALENDLRQFFRPVGPRS